MIDREGRYYIDNNEVLNPGWTPSKEALARIGGDDHERMVTLRADGQTPHQAVVTAMDALGQLGFTHLSIATTPNKDSKGQVSRGRLRPRRPPTGACSATPRATGGGVRRVAGMVTDAGCMTVFARVIKPMLDDLFIARDAGVIFWMPIVIVTIFLVRSAGTFATDRHGLHRSRRGADAAPPRL